VTGRDWPAVGGGGLSDSGVDCMVLAFNALRLFGGF